MKRSSQQTARKRVSKRGHTANLAPEDAYVIGIIPDIHVPDHNVPSCEVAIKLLESARLDAFVQLGDAFDHEQIGRFVKDQPRKLIDGLVDDWNMGRALLHRMRDAARVRNPKTLWFQQEGNHETRLLKFESYHPQLRGLLNLRKHLGIDDDARATWVSCDSAGHVLRFVQTDSGIVPRVIVPENRHPVAEFGLTTLHGWSYAMHSAKATADMAPWPGPVVYGHTHNESSFTSKRFGWLKSQAYTIGSLGNLSPEYTRGMPTSWVSSIAFVYLARKFPGTYRVAVIRIDGNRTIGMDGKVISV